MEFDCLDIESLTGFDWDNGNVYKNEKSRKTFMKTTKIIPTFKTEGEERNFWETHDATEYFDTSKVKKVRFPNLKKTSKSMLR